MRKQLLEIQSLCHILDFSSNGKWASRRKKTIWKEDSCLFIHSFVYFLITDLPGAIT